jgi:hypothetical protein
MSNHERTRKSNKDHAGVRLKAKRLSEKQLDEEEHNHTTHRNNMHAHTHARTRTHAVTHARTYLCARRKALVADLFAEELLDRPSEKHRSTHEEQDKKNDQKRGT